MDIKNIPISKFFLNSKLFFLKWVFKKKKKAIIKLLVSIKSQFHKPPQNNSWSDHKEPNKITKIIKLSFFNKKNFFFNKKYI